jgi:hypothetical protein
MFIPVQSMMMILPLDPSALLLRCERQKCLLEIIIIVLSLRRSIQKMLLLNMLDVGDLSDVEDLIDVGPFQLLLLLLLLYSSLRTPTKKNEADVRGILEYVLGCAWFR